jgi:hypothetical protein
MAYFAPEHWVALLGVCALGILAILHVLAAQFRCERNVHDLRIQTTNLRKAYSARLAAMRSEESDVIEVDEALPHPAVPLQKAA